MALLGVALLLIVPTTTDIYAFGAAQVPFGQHTTTHGIVFVGARVDDVAGGTLELWYNTDTLHARLSRLQLASELSLGLQLDGEAIYAGVLPDYYRHGRIVNDHGFDAGYIAATADLAFESGHHSLREAITARRWLFSRAGDTADDFKLPDTVLAVEERLTYTYWALADDYSFYDWHRTTQRIHGFAFSVELGLDARAHADPWGAPDDPRNRPTTLLPRIRQQAMFGADVRQSVRFQVRQWSGTAAHDDDLSRMRVGGNTPYAIPIAGAPWPAFLVSTYAALEATLAIQLGDTIEVGPLIDAAALVDRDRTGSHAVGAATGVGAFADLPLGAWQFDVRGGWSPPTGWQHTPQFSAFVAFGRVF